MAKLKLRSEQKFDAEIDCLEAHGACFLDIFPDAPAAPDNTALANASEESARIGAAQADRVLAESQRQYDKNMEVVKPVVDAQLGIMRQSKDQGDDYYKYLVSRSRPVEDALNADAMDAGSQAKQDEMAARAVADSQGSFTRDINQTIRAGKRYGLTPVALSAGVGDMAGEQASRTVAAATGARDKEKQLGFAKKLDVAGLYRGLPGASTGAYNAATSAGNSAAGNQMAPGSALQTATTNAAGLTMQGQGQKLSGLSSVAGLNNANYQAILNDDGGLGGLGSMLGGAASLYTAISSEEEKEDKTPINAEGITKGLERVPVEAWRYKKGVADEGVHIGPYAEDVQR